MSTYAGIFPAGILPAGLFPAGYFGGSSVSPARTLDEAVYDRLGGDATLAGLVGDRVWADFAPARTAYPVVVYTNLGFSTEYQSRGLDGYVVAIERWRYQAVAYATARDLAVEVGEAAGAVLQDAPLDYSGGVVVEARRDPSQALTLRTGRKGPRGADVWSRVVPFEVVTQVAIP